MNNGEWFYDIHEPDKPYEETIYETWCIKVVKDTRKLYSRYFPRLKSGGNLSGAYSDREQAIKACEYWQKELFGIKKNIKM